MLRSSDVSSRGSSEYEQILDRPTDPIARNWRTNTVDHFELKPDVGSFNSFRIKQTIKGVIRHTNTDNMRIEIVENGLSVRESDNYSIKFGINMVPCDAHIITLSYVREHKFNNFYDWLKVEHLTKLIRMITLLSNLIEMKRPLIFFFFYHLFWMQNNVPLSNISSKNVNRNLHTFYMDHRKSENFGWFNRKNS